MIQLVKELMDKFHALEIEFKRTMLNRSEEISSPEKVDEEIAEVLKYISNLCNLGKEIKSLLGGDTPKEYLKYIYNREERNDGNEKVSYDFIICPSDSDGLPRY
jgi:hypothetical protein